MNYNTSYVLGIADSFSIICFLKRGLDSSVFTFRENH